MLRIFEGLYKLAITSVFFDWRLFRRFLLLLPHDLFCRRLSWRRLTLCIVLDVSSSGFRGGNTRCRPALDTSRLLFTALSLLEVLLAGQFKIGGLE